MASLNEKFKSVTAKLKSIKHIEIIIAVIAVALMILIFSGISGKSAEKKETADKTNVTVATATDTTAEWENRLAEVLSKVNGVGTTEVMITVKSTTEKITAKTVSTNTSSSQGSSGNITTSTNTTESPVLVSNNGKSEPYILKEIMPEIQGVIVVAEGADNPTVKLAIMRAVQTVLQVNASSVEIYPMK